MRSTSRNLVGVGVFTALLIGGQFVLSAVAGIEIVTVLLLTYCYQCGVRQGMLVANAFTLLRCFIFGFMPNVLLLYCIYYNLFAVVIGLTGRACKHKYTPVKHLLLIALAVGLTALFTVLDNVVTPLLYGYSNAAAKVYWVASLYTVIPQVLCAAVTTAFLFPLLLKLMQANKIGCG